MKPVIKTTLIYLLAGSLWILVTDSVLLVFFNQDQLSKFSYLQTAKGVFFIVSTSILLFILLRRHYTSINRKMEELKLLNEELNNQSQKLKLSNDELEQFAYIASHDIQEPLRMVTSFLTQLERNYADQLDDKARQYIHFAVDGARRMRQIVLDLLEFSRVGRQIDNIESIPLTEIVDEVWQVHQDLIKNSRATVSYENLPVIRSYRSPLIQIFQNLIGNALKYSRQNVPAEIFVTAKDSGNYWEISVRDNGIGIEPKYFEKIFIIFQRLHAKDQYGGSGMGLAIVKKIVENLGGQIRVESEWGQGSIFYFTLPKL